MAWLPTNKIVDTRFIGKNIVDYVKLKDAEALEWANGGEPLKEFKLFSDIIENRDKPVFPLLAVTGESEGADLESDLNMTVYEITFEAIIYSANVADLPAMVKKYAAALKSILSNIPGDVLSDGVEQPIVIKEHSVNTEYDDIRPNEAQNGFMQLFQTKAIYRLYASRY